MRGSSIERNIYDRIQITKRFCYNDIDHVKRPKALIREDIIILFHGIIRCKDVLDAPSFQARHIQKLDFGVLIHLIFKASYQYITKSMKKELSL